MNKTVKELIDILKELDPNSVVCNVEMKNDIPIFSSIEICRQFNNVTYINDSGDTEVGNIVAIY